MAIFTETTTAETELARYKEAEQLANKHLAPFDEMDLEVYSHQDGSIIVGIPDHVANLKQQFVFAPDTKIKQHAVRIANGAWTSVIGTFEGTFSKRCLPLTARSFRQPAKRSSCPCAPLPTG